MWGCLFLDCRGYFDSRGMGFWTIKSLDQYHVKTNQDPQVSLGVSKVDTNRDRDFLICRDQLLKPVKIFSTVKTSFFCLGWDFINRDFWIEIWLRQDFQDFWDKSRFLIETRSRQIETLMPNFFLQTFCSFTWSSLSRPLSLLSSFLTSATSRLLTMEGVVASEKSLLERRSFCRFSRTSGFRSDPQMLP